MIRIYGMASCPDCVYVERQAADNPHYETVDIGSDVRRLKEFLRLRDAEPAFDGAKRAGAVGIPCFVLDDGRVTLVPEEAGLQSGRVAFAAFRHRKAEKMKKSFFLVLLRPKVPKASARRFPRERASHGAARGAQDQALAPPRDGRAACRTLFFPRRTRVRISCAAVGGKGYDKNKYVSATCAFFYPARRFPTWFRWRKSGRRTESESGGDGLLANPRSRPTPLSDVRTPTSESVGWLLLLFDTEKQLKKKKFSARRPKIAKGFRENFCCLRHRKAEKKEKISDALFRKMQSGFVEGGTQKRGKEKIYHET